MYQYQRKFSPSHFLLFCMIKKWKFFHIYYICCKFGYNLSFTTSRYNKCVLYQNIQSHIYDFFFLKSDIWNGPWYKNKKIKCIAKYLISAFPIDKNPSLIRYQLSNKSIGIWNLHDINNDLNAHEFTIWSTEKNDDIHTHTQKWILSGKKS